MLLGIALDNNRVRGVNWNLLRDFDAVQERNVDARQSVRLDRDDVFSAAALGFRARGSNALDCLADVRTRATDRHEVNHELDLTEDNTLFAIAARHSLRGSIDFLDIASHATRERDTASFSRTFDLDREKSLLALVVGARA